MKRLMVAGLLALTPALLIPGTARQKAGKAEMHEMKVTAMAARFSPTVVTASLSHLSPGDRRALERIIGAARYMDAIFERQVWSGNVALEKKLEANHTPTGRELLHYFRINAGPWSRLDEDKPFIAGVPQVKPPEGTFYPDGMTREEFNDWVKTLPDKDKADATSFFSVIRRGPDGKLKSVPYSQEYKPFLDPASKLLAEAAGLTTNPSLKAFLTKRAEAFHSNDYYDSDVAWMDLDSPIDLTIGPYETYEDGLFNYKAAFEAFVTLRDEGESAKLAKFSTYLQDIENNLPEDPKYRNPRLGAGAPIRVVNEVFASGDGNRGVQTAAFNLPNDPKIVNERGAKRVMLKNVQQAKFDKILLPISRVCLSKSDQKDLSFEAFFTHILAHELMHGLGPHTIQVNGRETSVGLELKDQYSAIEEAKADITGLFALGYLMDKGVVDKSLGRYLYTTYLASAFRSVRFGITEAHGKGVALQFNYLVEKGAIKYDARSGLFTIDNTRIKDAVRDLTHDLLTIEAEGSYDGAKAILDKYGVIGPEMKSTLERLKGVPVDIEPFFPIAARVQGPRK